MVPIRPDRINKTKRKSIEIQINSQGKVIVRAPTWASENQINSFVQSKSSWIWKKVGEANKRLVLHPAQSKINPHDIPFLKQKARIAISDRVGYYAKIMELSYKNIRISNAKTRWGSCSPKNTLSFSWRLILFPQDIIDYVVVHELAHIKHKNHSKMFWDYVKTICPDYLNKRKWLRHKG